MDDLEKIAIDRLKAASEMSLQAYKQPLVVCISGGKDSSGITELAIRAGIPVEFMHNHTTADAPETVRFVRSEMKRLHTTSNARLRTMKQICVCSRMKIAMSIGMTVRLTSKGSRRGFGEFDY